MKSNSYVLIGSRLAALVALSLVLFVSGTLRPATAQNKDAAERVARISREHGQEILKALKDDLKKNYYDPNFHGMDVEARFKIAQEKIKTAAPAQIYSIIAQVLADLNDSHTYFLPPDRLVRVDYGWRMQMIGDKCYVIIVKPGSDAAAKGLKVGDLIYSIDGYEPTRENLWKIQYSYYTLKPRGGMRVVIEEPNGQLRQVDLMIKAMIFGRELTPEGIRKVSKEEREEREKKEKEKKEKKDKKEKKRESKSDDLPSYHELNKELLICRLPEFSITEKEVDELMKRVAPYQALILDLRRNPGGYLKSLRRFVGYFFDHDIKIADTKYRKDLKPVMAKTRQERVFKGRLVVLVDGNSASAAEAFARLMQLEKRGTVIGDRTSGKVMQGMLFTHVFDQHSVMTGYIFISPWTVYGASITNADIIMSDGKSIEHVGVMPDELLLPTGPDLAAGRDPVLARAAALLGVELDAKQAGAIFPRERSTEVVTDDPDKQDDEDDNEEN